LKAGGDVVGSGSTRPGDDGPVLVGTPRPDGAVVHPPGGPSPLPAPEVAGLTLPVVLLDHAPGLPERASVGAAGLDLRAAEAVTLAPGARALVPTGLVLAIPEGWEGQVRPRSGLALKHGVTVLNAPGTIDADYRGEVKVLLVNLGEASVALARGDRVAQLVLSPVASVTCVAVTAVEATARGAGGFGSSGLG
jgi:dUTP pyrophosphatase